MHDTAAKPTAAPRVRLGEELPVFCEKCGYSLHGLPQTRCEHCNILQFNCPECGHHQPINTLRPAFQSMLGRIRAWWLGLWVAVRIIAMCLLLFAWAGMGATWAYRWSQIASTGAYGRGHRELSWDMLLAFGIFGFFFGFVWRLLLLRWPRGVLVGLTLGALAFAATCVGVLIEWSGSSEARQTDSIFGPGLLIANGVGACSITLAASIAWLAWAGLVRAFLPRRPALALLEWQRSMSNKSESALAREPISS